MRYSFFLALAGVVLFLDALFIALALLLPATPPQYAGLAVAQAAPQPASPTSQPTATIYEPTSEPSATPTSAPTHVPSPTSTPTPFPPTSTPTPAPRILAEHAAAFTPPDRAMRYNIRLALDHEYAALTHVFVPPGSVFSFNAALGAVPQRLPWKYVAIKATPAPTVPAPEGATPAPLPPAEVLRIQGGGLCDLASRYVMAARPLLPARAFRFVNHVRSTGIGLRGVPTRDTVSIWAVGGGPGEQDLRITNVTDGWLEFVVERDGEAITVRARLWDRMPR
ncbi:MAG TPA: hypothetical protein VFX76_10880 [Roseiflexaceae bacterium]|nr:hypothetical protein [Roseiflexaceae bacterium]